MDQTNETINVLNWNANSVRDKIHELHDFLIEKGIDIACIQETMYNVDDLTPAHSEFNIYRNDRITPDGSRAAGGVAILIKRNIKHRLLPALNLNLIEAIGVEIISEHGTRIQMWSAYLPGGANTQDIRNFLKRDILILTNRRCSYFINGDFNAKNRLWNCHRANCAGTILYDTHAQHNFLILYPQTHTHYPPSNNSRPSTIDLTLTNGMQDTSDLTTHTSASEHEMITYTVYLQENLHRNQGRKIPLFRMADWEKYKNYVETHLDQTPNHVNEITTTTRIDELVNHLSTVMINAQNVSVPQVTPTPYSVTLTTEIKDKIQMRNATRRYAQRNPRFRSIINTSINNQAKQIKTEINEIVNMNFDHKLSTLDDDKSRMSLWKMSKFLKKRRNQIPPLEVNDQTLLTPEEKSNAIANTFSQNHQNPFENEDITHTNHVNSRASRYLRNCTPTINNQDVVTTSETADIIKRLKTSKSPGLDRIHNALIKKMPHKAVLLLTKNGKRRK